MRTIRLLRTFFCASATALTLAFVASGVAQAQAPAAPSAAAPAALMTETKVFSMPS